jgi:mono/diheme cytochrome c family protein
LIAIPLRRVSRAFGALLGGLAALAVLAVLVLYVLGERILNRERDVPVVSIQVPVDADSIAEGERLATVAGCRGCHRPDLSGNVFFDGGLLLGRAVATNLSVVAASYSDEQLAATVRYGVRPGGRGMLGMPSAMYYHYTDEDLGAIIAYIRSMPPVEKTLPSTRIGPLTRWALVTGEFESDADIVARLEPRDEAPDRSNPIARGRYIAMTTCSECHGNDLKGQHGTPDLVISSAYTGEQFRHFMRTGEALGKRELRLMSNVARDRFSHLSSDEIEALHLFLRSMTGVE